MCQAQYYLRIYPCLGALFMEMFSLRLITPREEFFKNKTSSKKGSCELPNVKFFFC